MVQDLVGMKFGRWKVVSFNVLEIRIRLGKSTIRTRKWNCVCDCGTKGVIPGGNLRSGHSRSCGCFRDEKASITNATHGMSRSTKGGRARIYNIWAMMKKRCWNKDGSRPGYANIGRCKKWDSFIGFFEDMKDGYADHLELDRIDNSKGYSKLNCKWSTRREHTLNRNCAIKITINGITRHLADWCLENGIRYDTSYQRIRAYGWSPVNAVTVPKGGKCPITP